LRFINILHKSVFEGPSEEELLPDDGLEPIAQSLRHVAVHAPPGHVGEFEVSEVFRALPSDVISIRESVVNVG
jgi:hypothetical protein